MRKKSSWLLYVSEHVCQDLQGCVHVYSTTPSCPLPSMWASALHNSLFLCVSGWPHVCELFIASLHTLGMAANGEALVFITHSGHTKIFFFFWLLPFTRFCFPPPSCILLPARTHIPFWLSAHYVRSADVWVCSCTVCVDFKHICCILFTF